MASPPFCAAISRNTAVGLLFSHISRRVSRRAKAIAGTARRTISNTSQIRRRRTVRDRDLDCSVGDIWTGASDGQPILVSSVISEYVGASGQANAVCIGQHLQLPLG